MTIPYILYYHKIGPFLTRAAKRTRAVEWMSMMNSPRCRHFEWSLPNHHQVQAGHSRVGIPRWKHGQDGTLHPYNIDQSIEWMKHRRDAIVVDLENFFETFATHALGWRHLSDPNEPEAWTLGDTHGYTVEQCVDQMIALFAAIRANPLTANRPIWLYNFGGGESAAQNEHCLRYLRRIYLDVDGITPGTHCRYKYSPEGKLVPDDGYWVNLTNKAEFWNLVRQDVNPTRLANGQEELAIGPTIWDMFNAPKIRTIPNYREHIRVIHDLFKPDTLCPWSPYEAYRERHKGGRPGFIFGKYRRWPLFTIHHHERYMYRLACETMGINPFPPKVKLR